MYLPEPHPTSSTRALELLETASADPTRSVQEDPEIRAAFEEGLPAHAHPPRTCTPKTSLSTIPASHISFSEWAKHLLRASTVRTSLPALSASPFLLQPIGSPDFRGGSNRPKCHALHLTQRTSKWCAMLDLNQRQPACEAGALPLS